jgi:hypothetical protein
MQVCALLKICIMKKEETILLTDTTTESQDKERTWEDIKKELEIYWKTNPRYRNNNPAGRSQFEESELKQPYRGEWLA